MKKAVKLIVVMTLMFVSLKGSANLPKASLISNSEKTLIFKLEAQAQPAEIAIVNSDGVKIYEEVIQINSPFSKKFDLSALEEGIYVLEVDNQLKVDSHWFEITSDAIEITKRKENHKPIFRSDGKRVLMNILNLDKETVKIKVYDQESRIVYQENISNSFLIEKAFNFEKAFAGTYTIQVKDGANVYYEHLIIE